MKPFVARQILRLKATVSFAGDKSISHRAVILSALAKDKTKIENFPSNKDCISTVNAFRKLGIKIKSPRSYAITVFGKGLCGLNRPDSPIFVGDSGTTLRLILGVLAGQDFSVKLAAGKSLSRRPMLRVTEPLRRMGAVIKSKVISHKSKVEEYPPISIKGGSLQGINYRMPVASAQVKGAILLAGLYAKGSTKVIEPLLSRDHTERMLKLFRAKIKVDKNTVSLYPARELVSPAKIYIPGDISSASFFMVLAAILPQAKIRIKNVSLNPLRMGVVRVLKRMNADIHWRAAEGCSSGYEPMGDMIVKSSCLIGTKVNAREIPSLIDELPILMVAGAFALGRTIFEDVEELRVKETDRINSMSENLKKMGALVTVVRSGGREKIIVNGAKQLTGARVKSFGDHRTAMSMVVAGLAASGKTYIDDVSCIDKSFPEFLRVLKRLIR